MLENIDLKKKLDKATYKQRMSNLAERLYYVQQAAWKAGIPVAILFEGWDASGKGTTIHELTDPIDPRGYKIHPIRASRTYEKKRPWLWRFWNKIPARGEWAIFDRSWYGRVLVERMDKLTPEKEWQQAYRDIVDFERNLADDGTVIIKIFLHISKKEQKKRFKKLEGDPLNEWRVTAEDHRNHKRYDKWVRVYQEMIERTDTEWGRWTIVEATNKRFTIVKVYETIVDALEDRLGIEPPPAQPSAEADAAAPEEKAHEEAAPDKAAPQKAATEKAAPQKAQKAGEAIPVSGSEQPVLAGKDAQGKVPEEAYRTNRKKNGGKRSSRK